MSSYRWLDDRVSDAVGMPRVPEAWSHSPGARSYDSLRRVDEATSIGDAYVVGPVRRPVPQDWNGAFEPNVVPKGSRGGLSRMCRRQLSWA